MEGFTLTILDSTGIQEYIFGSNKLKENIGASHLLIQVSTEWLYLALEQVAPGAHNFSIHPTTISQKPLEKDSNQKLEVIYSGGGNVVILSRNKAIAKDVVRALSRKLLENAPGLEITAAHRPLAANDKIGGADGAYNDLLRTLNSAKQQRRQSTPQLGLSVTLACRATGLPAVHFDDEEDRHVSAEIQAKLVAVGEANKRLQEQFGEIAKRYAFSNDFDDFGRSRDDSSYIAVIHADGNGMGKRFEQLVAQFDDAGKNRDCLDALRTLSHAVEQSAKEALHDAINQLHAAMQRAKEGENSVENTELDQRMTQFVKGLQKNKQGQDIFPVRPLVFGGDDMTLVCDGRLGLALAAAYLKAFHKHTKEKLQTPAYACAGIAIVKAHYPFARAYTLSEALCSHAKTALRQEAHPSASAMDWHFAATGINTDLGELRKRQYFVDDSHNLTMRPVTVDGQGIDQPWREWSTLRQLIETFVNDEAWRDRRNKVIALREALRADDVEHFRHNYQIGLLPALNGGDANLSKTGWKKGRKDWRSGYFDAIEALDFYLPIELVQKEAS